VKHIFVRPIRPDEAGKFIQWSKDTANNLFDPDSALYPTSQTWCAYSEDGPICYMPVQHPFFQEALAFSPTASASEKASALKELTHNLVTQAHVRGVGEIYFFCADESTSEYAKRQGYEEVPHRLFRLKLKTLEKKQTP